MRACNITTTKALNAIGRKQAKSTETTRMWANWLLDYLATHPNAKILIRVKSALQHLSLSKALKRLQQTLYLWKRPMRKLSVF